MFRSQKYFKKVGPTKISVGPTSAFTLVELLVSVGIFAMMTALVVAKYGNFNNGVLLTNTAYDVALAIRTAQTYGLSVRSVSGSTPFGSGYGVHFDTSIGNNQTITLFSDINNDGLYVSSTNGGTDGEVSTFSMKQGASISGVCFSTVGCSGTGILNITFMRPNPDALICESTCPSTPYTYTEITITGTGGDTRVITVRGNGQIAVKN